MYNNIKNDESATTRKAGALGALFWKTIAKGDGFPEDNKTELISYDFISQQQITHQNHQQD
jgi:hypothetical protein